LSRFSVGVGVSVFRRVVLGAATIIFYEGRFYIKFDKNIKLAGFCIFPLLGVPWFACQCPGLKHVPIRNGDASIGRCAFEV
jgi:hypothetical protein